MKEASDRSRSDPLIYNGWGNVLADKQDYDGAIAKFQQALALNPQSEVFRNRLASTPSATTVHQTQLIRNCQNSPFDI
jgi:hypothetical protein